jgi:hypothetical protein
MGPIPALRQSLRDRKKTKVTKGLKKIDSSPEAVQLALLAVPLGMIGAAIFLGKARWGAAGGVVKPCVKSVSKWV